MAIGTVKWFNARKGYGFIVCDDGSADVFVHAKEIEGEGFHKSLFPEQRVEFEITEGPKGQFATNVKVIE